MSDSLIEAQRRFIALRRTKDDLEARAKAVQQQIDELTPVLAEQMAALGQSHTILDGVRLQVQVKPRISKRSDVPTERFCEVLRAVPELAYLVKPGVHYGQMQSALKEILEQDGELPGAVADAVRVYEQTVLYTTKA